MFNFFRPKPKQKNDTNLRTVVVFRIQMKVCQTILVTCLFMLMYHLFFHMMAGPLFILPVSDHGQLSINSIWLF